MVFGEQYKVNSEALQSFDEGEFVGQDEEQDRKKMNEMSCSDVECFVLPRDDAVGEKACEEGRPPARDTVETILAWLFHPQHMSLI